YKVFCMSPKKRAPKGQWVITEDINSKNGNNKKKVIEISDLDAIRYTADYSKTTEEDRNNFMLWLLKKIRSTPTLAEVENKIENASQKKTILLGCSDNHSNYYGTNGGCIEKVT